MFDHAIGIGADQRQATTEPERHALPIHVGGIVVGIEVGDDDGFRLFGRTEDNAEAFEQAVVDIGRADARGALVMRTTRPPFARKFARASTAVGWAVTPLWTTPQTSLRTTS